MSGGAWIAIFDILICLLDENDGETLHIRGLPGYLTPVTDEAYADDLVNVTDTLTERKKSDYNTLSMKTKPAS